MSARYRRGVLHTILWTFPITALLALSIGFPFPFAGYDRGTDAAIRSPIAVVMWGIFMGGFVVQGLLGCCATWIAHRAGRANAEFHNHLTTWYAAVAAVPGPLCLAIVFRFLKW